MEIYVDTESPHGEKSESGWDERWKAKDRFKVEKEDSQTGQQYPSADGINGSISQMEVQTLSLCAVMGCPQILQVLSEY